MQTLPRVEAVESVPLADNSYKELIPDSVQRGVCDDFESFDFGDDVTSVEIDVCARWTCALDTLMRQQSDEANGGDSGSSIRAGISNAKAWWRTIKGPNDRERDTPVPSYVDVCQYSLLNCCSARTFAKSYAFPMVEGENGWVIDQTRSAIYLQEELNIHLLLSHKVEEDMVCFRIVREETLDERNHVPDAEGSLGRTDYARFAIRRERVVRSCQKHHNDISNTKGKGAKEKHTQKRAEMNFEKIEEKRKARQLRRLGG